MVMFYGVFSYPIQSRHDLSRSRCVGFGQIVDFLLF
ncbi:hypothetical protein C357_13083 [Citreicella sp. 357]|nr:hypothetical protein C357_13083 [Citreicella sp. 357]